MLLFPFGDRRGEYIWHGRSVWSRGTRESFGFGASSHPYIWPFSLFCDSFSSETWSVAKGALLWDILEGNRLNWENSFRFTQDQIMPFKVINTKFEFSFVLLHISFVGKKKKNYRTQKNISCIPIEFPLIIMIILPCLFWPIPTYTILKMIFQTELLR